jgi:hypothetical protein
MYRAYWILLLAAVLMVPSAGKAAAFTQPDAIIEVPGTAAPGSAFINTGILIPADAEYFIQATGAVNFDPNGPDIRHTRGPDGEATNVTGAGRIHDSPKTCLLGRMGTTGGLFAIGSAYFGAGNGDYLYLGINDDAGTDNIGSFIVAIWVADPAAVPGDNTSREGSLGEIHPNPFGSSTSLAFKLERDSQVRITIYNVMGQRVRTLADEAMPAGQHSVAWDGRDSKGNSVAPGSYFYELSVDGSRHAKQAIRLK